MIACLRRRDARHGQSVVELAVALPVLLLILLGTIDVARVFIDYIQLRNAVVEGATYGSRHPFDSAGIALQVVEHGIPADAVVTSGTAGACDEPRGTGTVTVTASKTFTPIYVATLSAIAGSFSWSFDISANSTMRCLT